MRFNLSFLFLFSFLENGLNAVIKMMCGKVGFMHKKKIKDKNS